MIDLLFFLLPNQLGLHFWPPFAFVNGIRSDYLSPTLYLTDLIIFLLIIKTKKIWRVPNWLLGLVVVNIVFALSPIVAMYWWLRFYEYYCLLKILKQQTHISLRGLQLAGLWTVVLTWWQFLGQHSVGGLWYWLGERSFNLYTPGIARINVWGQLLLRPYATLPHPNALAGFLLLLAILLVGYPKTRAMLLLTIPLTLSKSGILLEVAVLVYWLIKKTKINQLKYFYVLWLGLYFLLPSSLDSVPQRIYLMQQAVQVIINHPWFGVGLGNFVNFVPTIRQPVHNIYLLLVSELGIVTTIFLGVWFRKINWQKHWWLVVVLLLGLVDHYWLTLPQNILLLTIGLAL